MPQITNQARYNAIYEAAMARFANADQIAEHLETISTGDPLYRYTDYRNAMPQAENAGRTIWRPIATDTSNRWTGNNGDGGGHRGLYLSGEYLDVDVPFPELDHYTNHAAPRNEQAYYYHYQQGEPPALVLADTAELKSMFLFEAAADNQGLNLELNAEGTHPLLADILEDARAAHPDLFAEGDTLQALYTAGDDASFCRAIGNAALEATDVGHIKVTSVRDGLSTNVIYRAPAEGNVVQALKPSGRATFMLRPGGEGVTGVTTILDLQYNARFAPPDQSMTGILPREVQIEQMQEISRQMVDNLAENYGEMLSLEPPNLAMEEVGKQIAQLQTHMAEGTLQDVLEQVGNIDAAITAYTPDVAPNIRQTFDVVKNALNGLRDISTSIEIARQEIDPADGAQDDLAPLEPDEFDPDFDGAPEPDPVGH